MADEEPPARVVDLRELARATMARQPIWSQTSEDLNVNLLVFDGPAGVDAHVNDEVDVLLVGVAGEGIVEIEGTEQRLASGGAIIVPKGARRAVRVVTGRFAYLTCHRRRLGLWPR